MGYKVTSTTGFDSAKCYLRPLRRRAAVVREDDEVEDEISDLLDGLPCNLVTVVTL